MLAQADNEGNQGTGSRTQLQETANSNQPPICSPAARFKKNSPATAWVKSRVKFDSLERQSQSKKMHRRCGTAKDENDNALATPTERQKNRRPSCRVKNVCSLTSRAIPSDRPSIAG